VSIEDQGMMLGAKSSAKQGAWSRQALLASALESLRSALALTFD
jgi:hypothetical protein